jgi:adenosylcobinamide-phosphate synthase
MDAEEAGVNPARSRHCHRGAILTKATVTTTGRLRGALIREPGDSGHRTVSPGRGSRVRTTDVVTAVDTAVSTPRAGLERAAGLGLGLLADSVLADPPRFHPVAGVGQFATRLERSVYQPQRRRGLLHLVGVTAPLTLAGLMTDRSLRKPWRRLLLTGALTWAAVGGRSLRREADALADLLAAGDLDAARGRISNLVGRDPLLLDGPAMARAAIESVAENTADAAVGPLVWGAAFGPAGVVAYRIVNTLDAMVGHHSERYERFGFPAARLDDLAGLLPARLTAGLAVVLAPMVGGSRRDSWRIWRRDASAHPSPNAGPCEAAFAGALGIRLGGPTVYPYGVSARPWHGDGPDPTPADVRRAARLSRDVTLAAGLLCVAGAALRGQS